jgi:hypothetical protein
VQVANTGINSQKLVHTSSRSLPRSSICCATAARTKALNFHFRNSAHPRRIML